MNRFRRRLQELASGHGVLLFDGAMGTQLQAAGLPAGECPERWNLERPQTIQAIHRAYVEAGAAAVETNTFGASRPKLARYGLAERTYDINYRAVTLAREAVGARAFVVGSMGPLGELLEPLGDITFEQAYEWFTEQAQALAAAGADAIIVETMGDLAELRAAVIAVKTKTDLPVIAHMTYTERGISYTGTGPEGALAVLEALGADVIGANCSVGPRELLPVMKWVAAESSRLVSVMPNAGIPELVGGETVFPMGPDEYASWAPEFIRAGVRVIGGCCGTTPEHIRKLAGAVEQALAEWGGRPPAFGRVKPLAVASRTKLVTFEPEALPILIGERLNPTGRKKLTRDIKSGAFQMVRHEARDQFEAGAHVLDVNMGIPSIDEAAAMRQAVRVVQDAAPAPLAIDSSTPAVIEAALPAIVGKPFINSVSGQVAKLERLLPLARKYGTGVVVLAMDDDGIPTRAEDRLAVAARVVEAAEAVGLRREDLIIDALCLPVGARQREARETLRAVRLIREELGLPVMIGLGNISYGMPERDFLNSTFLSMALGLGVDASIVNPLDPLVMKTVRTARVFLGRDPDARAYLSAAQTGRDRHAQTGRGSESQTARVPESQTGRGQETQTGSGQKEETGPRAATEKPPTPTADVATGERNSVNDRLYQAVLEGDAEAVVGLTRQAVEAGAAPMQLLRGPLIGAVDRVGELYGEGAYFLPQLMLSAEAMKAAFGYLRPLMEEEGKSRATATVVLATVQGDIHDIGKNICAILLENHGFRVVDLGRDVPAADIVDAVRRERAGVVGLSALMTTTMPQMRVVIDRLRGAGLTAKIMIGGAATTAAFAREIGADGYGRDAQEAVSEAKRLTQASSQEG